MLLKVPIEGKYMPTQASKAKNEAIKPAKLIPIVGEVDDTVYVAAVMAKVATLSMEDADSSVATPIFASCPNKVDPSRQDAMKQENTVP